MKTLMHLSHVIYSAPPATSNSDLASSVSNVANGVASGGNASDKKDYHER